MMFLSLALATPDPTFLDVRSPQPVHVLVDDQLIGAAWLDKTQQVDLDAGQVLKLECGGVVISPLTPRASVVVRVFVGPGPCQLGGSTEGKLLAILGAKHGGGSVVQDMWDDAEGDLPEGLGAPAPKPASTPQAIGLGELTCLEGCDSAGQVALKTRIRRFSGQLRYCAQAKDSGPGTVELTLERQGDSVGRVEIVAPNEATAVCMKSKVQRWKLPEASPARSRWSITLEDR